MRKRLLVLTGALALLIGLLPFTATAAAPDLARISATSYVDENGNESVALCDQEGVIVAAISYSGNGPHFGGSGTGNIAVELYGGSFSIQGTIMINGEEAYISGVGALLCLGSSGIVVGSFEVGAPIELPEDFAMNQIDPEEPVCGDLAGYIMDGVHKNQGRISLTLAAQEQPCLL